MDERLDQEASGLIIKHSEDEFAKGPETELVGDQDASEGVHNRPYVIILNFKQLYVPQWLRQRWREWRNV